MPDFSLFDHGTAPAGALSVSNEAGTYSLGVVVQPKSAGRVTSIWFYVGTTDLGGYEGGVHVYPYSVLNTVPDEPTPLASQNMTFRYTPGWQEVVLESPATVAADTRYVISVSFAAIGAHYTYVPGAFASTRENEGFAAESQALVGNGRFSDIGTDELRRQYPMKNFSNVSYGVDLTFRPSDDIVTTHFRVAEGGVLVPVDVTVIS